MLRRAVRSALRAVPQDGEVIVVDDGSATPADQSLGDIDDRRLHVLRNTGPSGGGGSAARNLGLSQARGSVLFLLDDDDEMLPHYCRHVLDTALRGPALPDYGFSAIELVRPDGTVRVKRRSMPEGLVARDIAFATATFPFSIGLWMTRATFAAVGPLDGTLPTNSDTEYSCRLRAAGRRLWYTASPGMRIHSHDGLAGQLAQVTRRISSADRARAFQTIIERHAEHLRHDPSARRFLLRRHLHLAAKGGVPPMDLRGIKGVSMPERFALRAFHGALRLARAPRRRGGA